MERALSPSSPWPEGVDAIWKIAITWHARGELKPGPYGPHSEPTLPSSEDPGWTFLGFDVADPGISGLTNCGYDPDEREELAATWSGRLNEHHLLSNLEEACLFADIANGRAAEHAPFFVLGLWHIP